MLGTQLHITDDDMITEQGFVNVRNNSEEPTCIKKPTRKTGLWTSPWREETQDSEWVAYCLRNDWDAPYEEKTWWLLTPRDGIKLFVVDTLEDMEKLFTVYRWKELQERR